jgi:acyl carrier protein
LDSSKDLQRRAQGIFREVFENPELVISKETVADDIQNWDSLTHISLVIALEEEFEIEFSTQEVTSMANVGDLFAAIERRQS